MYCGGDVNAVVYVIYTVKKSSDAFKYHVLENLFFYILFPHSIHQVKMRQ